MMQGANIGYGQNVIDPKGVYRPKKEGKVNILFIFIKRYQSFADIMGC